VCLSVTSSAGAGGDEHDSGGNAAGGDAAGGDAAAHTDADTQFRGLGGWKVHGTLYLHKISMLL